jgi:hypothetical protein
MSTGSRTGVAQLPLMYRITPAAQRYHVIRGGDGMGAEGAYAWHTIA